MKQRIFLALAAFLYLYGCAGGGVDFRPSDMVPSFERSASEWRGIMVSEVFYVEESDRDCFKTKLSETSPGSVLACSADPSVRATLRSIPFMKTAGSSPTRVRFRYHLMGGDQTAAIGHELRESLRQVIEATTASDSQVGKSLEDCRDGITALGQLHHDIEQATNYPIAPDHHGHAEAAQLGQQGMAAYFHEYPDMTYCSGRLGKRISAIIDNAPGTGFLEINGKFSWDR